MKDHAERMPPAGERSFVMLVRRGDIVIRVTTSVT
jgi:hypothetical protein